MTQTRLLLILLACLCCCYCSHKMPIGESIDRSLILQAGEIEKESHESSRKMQVAKGRKFLHDNYDKIRSDNNSDWASNRIYFDSLAKILFYVKDERFNSTLEKRYWALQKANFSKKEDREIVFSYYVRDRQFDEALRFQSQLPEWQSKDLSPPPRVNLKITNENEPTLLKVKNKHALEAFRFPASYTGLVMIGSPYCHFTKTALKDILKHKRDLPPLGKNILLVVPQEEVDLEKLVQWNSAHPDLAYNLVFRERAFEDFSFDTVPAFYFLKNGKVVGEVFGWPKASHVAKLNEEFKKLSLERGIK